MPSRILYSDRWSENSDRVLGFIVATDCTDLEIRVWVEACNVVTLSMVEIHKLPPTTLLLEYVTSSRLFAFGLYNSLIKRLQPFGISLFAEQLGLFTALGFKA